MKTLKTIILLAASVCLCSCLNDFLEAKTESSFTDETIFSDPSLATGAVMGIYESINFNSFNGRLWAYHGYNNDTERHLSSTSGVTPAQNDTHSAYAVYKYSETDNYFGDAFSYATIAIERANNCIGGLRAYGDTEHNADMAYLLGEALFLRAWIYYELVGIWGNIPARFDSLSNESLYAGRADRDVIWKQLLIFFFPILIGTFFQQLYNTVDTIVVGQYVGTNALAAVGTTGTLINLLVGFFVGVSSGATVIISQFFGAGDAKNVSKAVHTSMALALAGGLAIMVLGLLTARPSLVLLGVPEEILGDALTYMNVYYCGIIASMIYNVGTGVLRAIGDSRMPLYVLIVCCLVNIVLDLLFVLGFHWDVFGVAIATVLSQVVSAVLIMARLMLTRESYRVELKRIRFDKSILKNVIRIGLPAGMQSVLYSVSNLVVQASINSFGTDAIASWAAIGKIDGFIWMVMSAFGIAITTFVGQNFGAQQYARVKRSIKVCLGMALGTTIALSILLLVFMEPLLRFFTGDETVIAIGQRFFWVMAPSYFTYVFIEILSGAIRGAGESFQPMLITCFGVCGLRILWLTLVVPRFHTMEMVAMNYPVTWVIAAVVFILYYLRMNWLRRCIRRGGYPMPETL